MYVSFCLYSLVVEPRDIQKACLILLTIRALLIIPLLLEYVASGVMSSLTTLAASCEMAVTRNREHQS